MDDFVASLRAVLLVPGTVEEASRVPRKSRLEAERRARELEPFEHLSILSAAMGRKRSWLQEERRRTLGDWVALCLACGHVQRYFEDFESHVPGECPQCGRPLLHRCPDCSARIASAFAVECEDCGARLRADEGFGSRIRKAGR
jgi:predicted RNA-binding Zn-ribbon protein involved in translation (DUF1610 family)